jgi:hypothetical protein
MGWRRVTCWERETAKQQGQTIRDSNAVVGGQGFVGVCEHFVWVGEGKPDEPCSRPEHNSGR